MRQQKYKKNKQNKITFRSGIHVNFRRSVKYKPEEKRKKSPNMKTNEGKYKCEEKRETKSRNMKTEEGKCRREEEREREKKIPKYEN